MNLINKKSWVASLLVTLFTLCFSPKKAEAQQSLEPWQIEEIKRVVSESLVAFDHDVSHDFMTNLYDLFGVSEWAAGELQKYWEVKWVVEQIAPILEDALEYVGADDIPYGDAEALVYDVKGNLFWYHDKFDELSDIQWIVDQVIPVLERALEYVGADDIPYGNAEALAYDVDGNLVWYHDKFVELSKLKGVVDQVIPVLEGALEYVEAEDIPYGNAEALAYDVDGNLVWYHDKFDELSKKVGELQAVLSQRDSEISDLKDRIEEYRLDDIAHHEDDIAHHTEIEALKSRVASLEGEKSNLLASLTSSEARVTSLNSENAGLRSQVSGLESDFASEKAKRLATEADRDSEKSKRLALESENSRLLVRITGLEGDVDRLEDDNYDLLALVTELRKELEDKEECEEVGVLRLVAEDIWKDGGVTKVTYGGQVLTAEDSRNLRNWNPDDDVFRVDIYSKNPSGSWAGGSEYYRFASSGGAGE